MSPHPGAEPLPAMIPIDEVRARTQKDEMREFRTYLIERGAVSCLVKLYMHLMEKNRCNEDVDLEGVKDFLAGFVDDSNPHAAEIAQLEQENEGLRAMAENTAERVAALEQEIDFEKRKRLAWRYWTLLSFLTPDRTSLSGMDIWTAFCGDSVDPNTQVQPAQRIVPEFCKADYPGGNLSSEQCVTRTTWTRFVATEASEEVLAFLMDAVHLFEEKVGEGSTPFQETIMETYCCATSYPVSPYPGKKMVEVIAAMKGSREQLNSEQCKAWEVFETDVVRCLAEVRAPQAYPSLLLELMIALHERFGCIGDPPEPTEEELAELAATWEPQPKQAAADPAEE